MELYIYSHKKRVSVDTTTACRHWCWWWVEFAHSSGNRMSGTYVLGHTRGRTLSLTYIIRNPSTQRDGVYTINHTSINIIKLVPICSTKTPASHDAPKRFIYAINVTQQRQHEPLNRPITNRRRRHNLQSRVSSAKSFRIVFRLRRFLVKSNRLKPKPILNAFIPRQALGFKIDNNDDDETQAQSHQFHIDMLGDVNSRPKYSIIPENILYVYRVWIERALLSSNLKSCYLFDPNKFEHSIEHLYIRIQSSSFSISFP